MIMTRCSMACMFAVFVLAFLGCGHAPPETARPAPAVTVACPVSTEVADYEDFIGNTDAINKVDVRARVSGYLIKVAFNDGDIVKEGDLLYEIDPRPFQADLDYALGTVERLEAEKKLVAIQVERYRKLAKTGAGSQQDYDEYLGRQAENVGALKAAQAQVDRAKLNLDFTRITAPITGKISRTLLTKGNLVDADRTLLTTIMSIHPIYAYFPVEEPKLLEIHRLCREGVIPTEEMDKIVVRMGLADDVQRKFPLHGELDFVNNTIDPQTGTIQLRGKFPNPFKMPAQPPLIQPGMSVRIRLQAGVPRKTLLVSERAILNDQGEKYVYVVDDKNKVIYCPVKLGLLFDGLLAVDGGLKPGDRVIVNGSQRVRPGVTVKAEQIDMKSVEPKRRTSL
jgi:RND family efflux transporter MFP subunit